MDALCRKSYLFPFQINGKELTKRKITKLCTHISHSWIGPLDYEFNAQETADIEARVNDSMVCDSDFDETAYFLGGWKSVDSVSDIVLSTHNIVADINSVNGIENLSIYGIDELMNLNPQIFNPLKGRRFVIYIRNTGNATLLINMPQNQIDEDGEVVTDKYHNVGGSFLSLEPNEMGYVNLFYEDHLLFTEIAPKSNVNSVSTNIGEADFVTFRYLWDSSAGRDLDTATEIVDSGIASIDGKAVGWGCPGNGVKDITDILHWGGDNRQSGQEAVWISIRDFKEKYGDQLPEITNFNIYATWYASKGTGNVSFNLASYRGGQMSQSGFDFINTGGTLESSNVYDTRVDSIKGAEDYKNKYTYIVKIQYNKTTNQVSMSVGEAIYDQSQIKYLQDQIDSIKATIGDIGNVVDTINGEVV